MQYTFLCFGFNMDLSWYQDSRIHRLHRLPFNGSAWRTAWSACRSPPVYPSRWSALGPSHHGPCFWHMVFMQIGDSTSPNIYTNGDLPNKNGDLNVFLLKKNVIFTFQISDVKYEFLFSTHPPGISWEHHWRVIWLRPTIHVREHIWQHGLVWGYLFFFPMGSVFAFQGPRKKQSKTNKKEKHQGDATSLSGWWFGTFFIFPYIFPSIGNNHPNWRNHIFQRGRTQPPTSYWLVQNAIFIRLVQFTEVPHHPWIGNRVTLWLWRTVCHGKWPIEIDGLPT